MTKSIHDLVIEILEKTHDGNDLIPSHLKMLENAANGFLNEAGEIWITDFHNKIVNEGYTRPYFFNIEHLTRDNEGFVYWKGKQIEHYDHDHWGSEGWQERMKKDALELAETCRFLESRNLKVNFENYLFASKRLAGYYEPIGVKK